MDDDATRDPSTAQPSLAELAVRPMVHAGRGFWLVGLIAAVVAGVGAVAYAVQLNSGLGVTGLNDQVTGTVVQNSRTVQVNLTDARDSTLRVIIAVAGNSSTGRLLITKSGATVCDTTASVVQDVTATCGQTAVDVSLAQQADGTVAGQLVTKAAGQ